MGHSHKSIIKRLSNNFGFMLIEIIIVLIIVGLMVALVLPDFNKTIERYNLDNSARALALDIRSLQQAAIKDENTGFKIYFFTTSDTYSIIYFINNVNSTHKTVKLPSSVQLYATNFNGNTMEFAANGSPLHGVGGTVSLKDRKTGKFLYVIVDSIGRVRVSETPP